MQDKNLKRHLNQHSEGSSVQGLDCRQLRQRVPELGYLRQPGREDFQETPGETGRPVAAGSNQDWHRQDTVCWTAFRSYHRLN